MTTAAPEVARDEPSTDNEPPPPRRWPRVAILVGCALVLLYGAGRVAVHDPTELEVSGDQAAFTLQAVSIAGGDLSYDEQDYEGWLDLDWEDQPRGLFLQRNDEGWAFAKPYGYSLLLAPFVAAFGADGISHVGAGLLLAYAACWYAIGRTRWRPAGAALVATSATLASNAWAMAFPAHADLFVATVVGVVVLASVRMVIGPPVDRNQPGGGRPALGRVGLLAWPAVAAFGTAVLVTEKMPALVAIGPLLALALWRSPMRSRILAGAVGVVVVAVSVVPYLYYSDGVTWNAYGGDRYYTPGSTPFSGGTEANLRPHPTRNDMSPRRVVERLIDPSQDLPEATLTYVIGRHTGAVTHQPVIGALGIAAAFAVWRRWRRSRSDPDSDGAGVDDPDDPDGVVPAGGAPDGARRNWSTWALAASVVGLAGYVTLYLVAFTDNYYGGGQSVGNRYFLQISVLVAVIPVAAKITERAAGWSAVLGAAVAYVLITPHLVQADEAFFRLERTTSLQEHLPFEHSQSGNWRLQCGPYDPCWPGSTPVSGG